MLSYHVFSTVNQTYNIKYGYKFIGETYMQY